MGFDQDKMKIIDSIKASMEMEKSKSNKITIFLY